MKLFRTKNDSNSLACYVGAAWSNLFVRLLIFILIIIVDTFGLGKIFAQTYEIGYKKYTLGDIAGSELSLKKAVVKTRNSAEKAKIHKLLGITQHMQGKTAEAKLNFQKAIAYDPRTEVSATEVLDGSVIPFFKKIKQAYKKRRPAASMTQQQSKKVESSPTPTMGKPTKSTTIYIQSNVGKGSVFIDGILAGNTGPLYHARS